MDGYRDDGNIVVLTGLQVVPTSYVEIPPKKNYYVVCSSFTICLTSCQPSFSKYIPGCSLKLLEMMAKSGCKNQPIGAIGALLS